LIYVMMFPSSLFFSRAPPILVSLFFGEAEGFRAEFTAGTEAWIDYPINSNSIIGA